FITSHFEYVDAERFSAAQELLLMDSEKLREYERQLSNFKRKFYELFASEISSGQLAMPDIAELLPSKLEAKAKALFKPKYY
ncbi:MAG: hypothetical protein KDD62_14510, partial [Bdellovibrionales bacterium]|nr:hypothetical protein [Bdellovibrionales bacterium]